MTETMQRVALVTGGSSGIGRATAELLASDGDQVVIVGRDVTRLADVAAGSPRISTIRADLAERDEPKRVVEQVVDEFGQLDVLVNAHGILGRPAPLEDVTEDEWDDMLDTNLRAPIRLVTAAVGPLSARSGCVVNVGSINAIQAEPWMAPYGVSKGAIATFTKYAAADLADRGVRVNAVLPGWVRTPMAMPYFEEAGVVVGPMATNFQKRAAEPDELARVIAFLASSSASFITGECLVADGGHWINMRELARAEA